MTHHDLDLQIQSAQIVTGQLNPLVRRVPPDNLQLGAPTRLQKLLASGTKCFAAHVRPDLLAIDIDVVDDEPRTLFVEALRLAGHSPIVLASGGDGRSHVWVKVDEPEALQAFGRQAVDYGWDVRSMIRPPGVSHRLGEQPVLLDGADSWAEALDLLRGEVRPDAVPMKSANRERLKSPAAVAKGPVAVAEGTVSAHDRLPQRYVRLAAQGNAVNPKLCFRTGTAAHTAKCAINSTGRVTGIQCYPSASEATMAILTSAVQQHVTLDMAIQLIFSYPLGLARDLQERQRNETKFEQWLERSFEKANEFVAQRPPTRHHDPESLAQRLAAVRAASLGTPMSSPLLRATLASHILAAQQFGSVEGYVAPQEELAIGAAIGSTKSVRRAETKLIKMGYLRQVWSSNSSIWASRWVLDIPAGFSTTKLDELMALVVDDDPGHDSWRRQGLGKSAWEAQLFLRSFGAQTVKGLASLTGRSLATTRRVLNDMRTLGLVDRSTSERVAVWSPVCSETAPANLLDGVAQHVRTWGKRVHAIERLQSARLERDRVFAQAKAAAERMKSCAHPDRSSVNHVDVDEPGGKATREVPIRRQRCESLASAAQRRDLLAGLTLGVEDGFGVP